MLDLPSKYTNRYDIPEREKYVGWNQMSYSTYTAFVDETYRGEFIARKLLGMELPQPLFAKFGNLVGDSIACIGEGNPLVIEYLSDKDIEVIKGMDYPDGAEYEKEILIDMKPFGLDKTVFVGYIDRFVDWGDGTVNVDDFKTGSIEKKVDFYSGDDYVQTDVYSFGYLKENPKAKVLNKVLILDRKGNSMLPGAKYPLRLSGKIHTVIREYDEAKAISTLKDIAAAAKELDKYVKVCAKLCGL